MSDLTSSNHVKSTLKDICWTCEATHLCVCGFIFFISQELKIVAEQSDLDD